MTGDLIASLDPHEKRAVALVGLMIKMHGGKDGEGMFTGIGRYSILGINLSLCAEQSRSVREFWDRAARRMRWCIGPQRYDNAALALIAADDSDPLTLRAMAERTQSIVMIARSLARRDKTSVRDYGAPINDPPPFDDPLDIFSMPETPSEPELSPTVDAPGISLFDDIFKGQ